MNQHCIQEDDDLVEEAEDKEVIDNTDLTVVQEDLGNKILVENLKMEQTTLGKIIQQARTVKL